MKIGKYRVYIIHHRILFYVRNNSPIEYDFTIPFRCVAQTKIASVFHPFKMYIISDFVVIIVRLINLCNRIIDCEPCALQIPQSHATTVGIT